jgi:tetratricopeptide (TPR) repeat protein
MDKELIFFVINHEMVMRKIIVDFLRQMIRDDELPVMAKIYDIGSAKEALSMFDVLFKSESESKQTHKGSPVLPMPGFQRNAIAICDLEMEPMGGLELVRQCAQDERLREISFIMIAQKPDLGVVSQLGELGVYHIIVEPLTMDKFSKVVLLLAVRILSDEHYHICEADRLLFRGEYDKALKLIEEKGSKYLNLRWTILRGRAYLGMHETKKAAFDFEQVEMGAHIASVIALKHLVDVYELMGDTEKTIDSLSKLTQKNPANNDRKLKLAELYTDNNRLEEAKVVLDILAKDKRVSMDMKMRVANLFERGGFIADAANLEVQMVDGNLSDYILCNNLAISLRKRGRYELAEESYLKILEAHPDKAVIWFNRGVNLGFWGKKESDVQMIRTATDCLRKALKLDPHLKDASDAIIRLEEDLRARSRN